MVKIYTLWVEGYVANQEHGTAKYLGSWTAETFDDAVKLWCTKKNPTGNEYGSLRYDFHTKAWSVWGCRIFDNEVAARARFG